MRLIRHRSGRGDRKVIQTRARRVLREVDRDLFGLHVLHARAPRAAPRDWGGRLDILENSPAAAVRNHVRDKLLDSRLLLDHLHDELPLQGPVLGGHDVVEADVTAADSHHQLAGRAELQRVPPVTDQVETPTQVYHRHGDVQQVDLVCDRLIQRGVLRRREWHRRLLEYDIALGVKLLKRQPEQVVITEGLRTKVADRAAFVRAQQRWILLICVSLRSEVVPRCGSFLVARPLDVLFNGNRSASFGPDLLLELLALRP